MTISTVDPVPWLRVMICAMRFVQHILTRLALLFAVGIIMASPIASASTNHSCCPETYQANYGSVSHDLMVHYSQAMKISHSMIGQESDTDPSAPDKVCDVSCCINVAGSALVLFLSLIHI